jgi:simple sugar transport system permease protein
LGIVHWGLPAAILASFILSLFVTYTHWGYEVRIAGANPEAARYAGMPVKAQLIGIMLLSGGLAGLGGMMEVAGTVGRLQGGISNNYGYIGIMVAVLARAAPIGVLITAFFMAVLLNGGIVLQSQGLTTHTVLALTGLILLYAAIGEEAAHYKILRTQSEGR